MTLRKVLIENHNNFLGYQMREFYIHGDIPFFIVHDLDPEKVNIQKVINVINQKIPKELFHGVDGIYVAHLPEFEERAINAIYKDSAIYVTNQQDNNLDMIDDIVHELAHSVESHFQDFLNSNYDEDFDFYLYDEVGYNALDGYIEGCFLSPYSATSMREYFAVAFTDYFLYDRDSVKKICPAAYLKIRNLIKKGK